MAVLDSSRPAVSDDATLAQAFNLFDVPADYLDSPYPWFRRLRDHDPIHANADGSVLLTRYADVKQVWRDVSGLVDKSAMFTEKFGQGPLLEHHTTSLLFRDPPDHDRLRAILNPFFSGDAIAALKPFIETRVNQLLDDTAARGGVEFVGDFAFRLPVAVICQILGVPQSDGDLIQEMGRRVLFPLNPKVTSEDIAAGHAATQAFKDYLRDFVEAARKRPTLDPKADLISALVHAERSGAEVSENEILHMCILVLNGGHETTTNLISGSLNALLDAPEKMREMREDDPGASAIQELIRFVTPLQLQGRRTTKPIELESGTIAADTEVIVCQASANRDERVFDAPDTLNLRRTPNAHMAFGAGLHACIGRPLARLEAGIAIPAILQRFKTIERTGPVVWNPNVRFRGIKEMPLAFA